MLLPVQEDDSIDYTRLAAEIDGIVSAAATNEAQHARQQVRATWDLICDALR